MASIAVVSGCSGFFATQLTKQLLEKGYTVRGTVRSTKDAAKTEVLHNLAAALPGNLELHEADLLREGSFDEVVRGSNFVFHTASPFFFGGCSDPQKELVDPAVNGTKNVLSSVVKSKDTIQRVILTSSMAAVIKEKAGPSNGKVYSEADWNDESDLSSAYMYSKTLAERAAWELSKEHGFDMVALQPGFMIGPILGRRADATSIKSLQQIAEGKETKVSPRIIDVRDVARAHVLAAELKHANGRYLLCSAETHELGELYAALAEHYPQYKYPKLPYSSKPYNDLSKVKRELGLHFMAVGPSIIDAAATLYSIGLARPPT